MEIPIYILTEMKILAFNTTREVVDAARARELLAPFVGHTCFHTISLRGKSYTLDGAYVLASYLQTLQRPGLKIADLADIIAGRPEEEALSVLQCICASLAGHVLEEINLSDNALGTIRINDISYYVYLSTIVSHIISIYHIISYLSIKKRPFHDQVVVAWCN